jgi:hypothetical protein
MIVITEDQTEIRSALEADLRASTDAARIVCDRLFYIKDVKTRPCEEVLSFVPEQEQATPCAWIGYSPTARKYAEMYEALMAKGLVLLNEPIGHNEVTELLSYYPAICDITPRTVRIDNIEECGAAGNDLKYPVFIKGAEQSKKGSGWEACVANDLEHFQRLVGAYLKWNPYVIGRQFVNLKYSRTSPAGFRFGREYRVFLYNRAVLAYGYYWDGDDPLKSLTSSEESSVLNLAVEAARKVRAPFIVVDVGQTEDDRWIIIEMGDAQFAGLGCTPGLTMWNNLNRIVSEHRSAQPQR